MTRVACTVLAAAMVLASRPAAQQPRDNQRAASTGTASISGVVVADDQDARPLRRARVTISGSELDLARTAITSDDGVFAFERLPAGRYTLTASKDGYASLAFGAQRPGRPGRPVTLSGHQARRVSFKLPHGAVITGTIRDPQGDPAAGVTVVVLTRRYVPTTAERRLTTVPNTNTVTDDRGIYRIFGLEAGSYLVTALPRLPSQVTTVSREDVQRALAEVQERRSSPRPGIPAPSRRTAPPAEPRATVTLAPTYFPGTTVESRATAIELVAGQVRGDVDFDLDYVPMATVEGLVTIPPGTRVQLMLSKADPASPYQGNMMAIPGADGRFAFRRVQPGHYAIQARAVPPTARTGATPREAAYWARTEVIVAGENIEGVTLALEPALTLSGPIHFDSRERSGPVLENFRVPLRIGARTMGSAPLPSVLVSGDRVTLQGVVPGAYRFMSPPPGIRAGAAGWWLKSILIEGKEALDEPLTIPPSAKQLEVRFSDRASELSGTVTDNTGAPVTDAFAVIFTGDPKSWFPHSRRVAAVRLNDEGRYVVWNLPAGDYFVAISSDLENNEWFDPETLEALKSGAGRVSLAENERKTLDIRQP